VLIYVQNLMDFNMKNILISLALSLLVGCAASVTIPISEQNTTKIIDVKGQSKAEIFAKTDEWFAETYKNYSKVVEMKSLTSGKFTARAIDSVDFGMGMSSDFYYNIHIDIKDEKARIKTFNYVYTDGGIRVHIVEQFNDAQIQMKEIIDSYERKLLGEVEDW
jgi:hypothetical protein